jgi:hypothetical protein
MMFDEKTAFWWFKVSPPLQLRGGSRPWLMTIDPATNNPFSLAICGPMQLGSQPEVVGCYLEDCPTNIPTFVINFVTQKTRIMAGESFIDKFITNITVPNPLYRR